MLLASTGREKMTRPPVCPKCGSDEILPHAKGTFQADGLICIACGHVFPGSWPPKPRIIIKGWRTPDDQKVPR